MPRFHSFATLFFVLVSVSLLRGQEPRVLAQPEPDSDSPIRERLASIVGESDLGAQIGVHVVRLSDGAEMYSHHEHIPRNPASNMKLITAAAALFVLGPERRFRTRLAGRIRDGRIERLVLSGDGDPSLTTADLIRLAEALADRGVRRVDTVVVDDTYFDDVYLPPAFEQQPREVASFRAAISAVSVDRSAYTLRVMPGREVGSTARVRLFADSYFELQNRTTTSDGGEPNVIAAQSAADARLELNLSGSVPNGILGVSYRRRVAHPSEYAGHVMVSALSRAGIRSNGNVRVGSAESLPVLTFVESEPVAVLLNTMGKWSDNYTAEMMFKHLGAGEGPATFEGAQAALREFLTRAGVSESEGSIVNGSGLFDGNEIAPSHLTTVLRYIYENRTIRPEYVSHLAVGGRAGDGTLRRRFREGPAGAIRAKTGTLNDVISLSGYVLSAESSSGYAFSVLLNGIRGRQAAARNFADEIASALTR